MAVRLHHALWPNQPGPALVLQIPARVSLDCAHITYSECPERGIIRALGFAGYDYSEVEIRGLTKPLVDQLCNAKYRDEWRDARGRVMRTPGSLCDPSGGFGPGYSVEWSWPDDPFGTHRFQDTIYLLEDIPLPGTNGNFTATWRLLAPNGRQVLQARYRATINRPAL